MKPRARGVSLDLPPVAGQDRGQVPGERASRHHLFGAGFPCPCNQIFPHVRDVSEHRRSGRHGICLELANGFDRVDRAGVQIDDDQPGLEFPGKAQQFQTVASQLERSAHRVSGTPHAGGKHEIGGDGDNCPCCGGSGLARVPVHVVNLLSR